MLRKWAVLVLVVGGLSGFSLNEANAGVRGNTYSGPITQEGQTVGSSCIEFLTNGTVEYNELFDGDPLESFAGTYSEFDLILFSFFAMTMRDGSQDALFSGTGFSIFGIVAFTSYTNPDFSVDWQVTYTPSNCTVNVRSSEGSGKGGH